MKTFRILAFSLLFSTSVFVGGGGSKERSSGLYMCKAAGKCHNTQGQYLGLVYCEIYGTADHPCSYKFTKNGVRCYGVSSIVQQGFLFHMQLGIISDSCDKYLR